LPLYFKEIIYNRHENIFLGLLIILENWNQCSILWDLLIIINLFINHAAPKDYCCVKAVCHHREG
jgi:hypothetical protein